METVRNEGMSGPSYRPGSPSGPIYVDFGSEHFTQGPTS